VLTLQTQRRSSKARPRRGSLVMVVAMALLVIGCCLALVFDRLWLDTAQVELQAAAEASALAGAGQLATDDRLNPKSVDLITPAREAAKNLAAKNFAVGSSVSLQDQDILIGTIQMDPDNGHAELVEDTDRPTTVVVKAARTKGNGNPIALFFRDLTGRSSGDAQAIAEASVDNRIIGVQPNDGSPVPALPMSILHTHHDPRRLDTWQRQIEMRLGLDRYSVDPTTNEITAGPDGIPEILLHTAALADSQDDSEKVNLLTVDVGNGLKESRVAEQLKTGWTVEDLKSFGEEFRTDQGPQTLDVDAAMIGAIQDELQGLIGQTRICTLYTDHKSTSHTIGTASVVNLVAIRILAVEETGAQKLQITAQPAVIATRTALLDRQDAAWLGGESDGPSNPYIYKLFLSH
jgi:hypothetical protein